MRQGQQSRRGRNRGGGGGRKPQNPISRNYESSGPDIKIRGTAMHIAEKYTSLARDAMASGDIIAAENYLQHAEHYNRIVMAAQTQAQAQPVPSHHETPNGMNGGSHNRGPYPDFLYREVSAGMEDFDGDEPQPVNGYHAQPYGRPQPASHQPQPYDQQPGFAEPAAHQNLDASGGDEVDRQPRRRRRRPPPGIGMNGRDRAANGEHGPESDDSAPDKAAV